jgi:DNA polymerase III gamma/tau subunit
MLEQIIEEFGLEGYARWWLLLEAVAKNMDDSDKCSVEYSWTKWQQILRGKRNKLETFLERFGNKLEMNQKRNGNVLEIKIPKLLELRDNYTKNLQAANNKPCKQEVEVEVEVHKPVKPVKYKGDFDAAWKEYPNKVGKSDALKRFNATVKSKEDETNLRLAMKNYLNHLKIETWKRPQNGSTWFNQWRDWVEYEHVEHVGELSPQQKQIAKIGTTY